MNTHTHRYFYDPQPSKRDILDCVSSFTDAVNKSLRKGVNRGCQFTVNFRTDVFTFLFKNKGSQPERGRGHQYSLDDFDSTYFPPDWNRVHDTLGDGCELDFPVRMYNQVKWSPTVYSCSESGIIPKKRHYEEICTLWVVKNRC